MTSYTTQPPTYTQPGDDSVSRVQEFELVDAKKVRPGGNGSTPAWEFTFKIPSGLKFSAEQLAAAKITRQNIGAGMQVALYGVNDDASVEKVLGALKPGSVPEGQVMLPLPARDGPVPTMQLMDARTAIAHTVDLTRPTPQLLKKCGINSNNHAYDDMPVADFLQLPGVRDRLSFDMLRLHQPPLQNRKYTPSEVDVANGTVRILMSETHYTRKNGKDSPGTTSGYLADLGERFLQGDRGIKVNGLLDTRKHKLPYRDATGPRILIGTGVGIAPHVAWLRQCAAEGKDPNVALFLSGERNAQDHLLADDITRMLPEPGVFHHVYSQPGKHSKGQYVNDALAEHADVVWRSLHDQHGTIYLCGHEGMRKGVEEALRTIAAKHLRPDQAAEWASQIMGNGKQEKESLSWPDRFYHEKWPKIWEGRQEEIQRLEGGRGQG